MANATPTSPAPNPVRPPNAEERLQLADWLRSLGNDREDAIGTAEAAYVTVFDHYATDCPGYAGKVMSVVWGAGPSFFDVFYWRDGKLMHSGREYDEKQCDHCGTGTAPSA